MGLERSKSFMLLLAVTFLVINVCDVVAWPKLGKNNKVCKATHATIGAAGKMLKSIKKKLKSRSFNAQQELDEFETEDTYSNEYETRWFRDELNEIDPQESFESMDDETENEVQDDRDDNDPDRAMGSRLLGGDFAASGECRWLVSVYQKGIKGGKPIRKCGGAYIHPQVVITAASCFAEEKYSPETHMILGPKQFYVSHTDNGYEEKEVAWDILLHHKYNCGSPNTAYNLALVYFGNRKGEKVVARGFSFESEVLRLPMPRENGYPWSDRNVSRKYLLYSEGPLSFKDKRKIVRKSRVPLYAAKCAQLGGWRNPDAKYEVCTKMGSLTMCKGEQGSSFIDVKAGRPTLRAVISFFKPDDCDQKRATGGGKNIAHPESRVIAVSIRSHMKWILKNIEEQLYITPWSGIVRTKKEWAREMVGLPRKVTGASRSG